MTNPDHTGTPAATECATVYLVFELSKATWKLGLLLPGSKKLSRYAIGRLVLLSHISLTNCY